MGHGPIGAVKFSGSIYKTSGGLRLGEGCTAIDGVHLGAGTGHNQAWGAAHWKPGAGRGALDAGLAPLAPHSRPHPQKCKETSNLM